VGEGEGPSPEDDAPPLIEPTGTWWDELLPVYASLGIPGPLRRGYTLPEVDAMPIPVVGALLRMGHRPTTIEEQAADMLRRRIEWERLPPELQAVTPPPDW
jgi:hypothetical protein